MTRAACDVKLKWCALKVIRRAVIPLNNRKVARNVFRSIEKPDSKQSRSLARPHRFSECNADNDVIIPPRFLSSRSSSSSSFYGAPSYSIHVTLLHSPSRFALVTRRRYHASRISTVRDRFTISIESNFFHGQQRELVHSRRELARRCGGQCVSYYPPCRPNGVYTEAFTDRGCFNYRSRSLPSRDDGVPFRSARQDGMRNSSPRDVPRVLMKCNVNRCCESNNRVSIYR